MKLFGLAAIFFSFATTAQATIFEAPVTDSHWVLTENPTSCELYHVIEGYGGATFVQHADQSLSLRIETENYAAQADTLTLRLISSPWKNTQLNEMIGEQVTQPGQLQFQFEGKPAKLALTGLQNGDFVNMRYQSESRINPISVHLSSVNFYLALQNFQVCSIALNPETAGQGDAYHIKFASAEAELDNAAMRLLDRLANTLENDNRIHTVLIESHTDSFGKQELNTALSTQRAAVVRDFLINQVGYEASKIETRSHADTRPIADNKTPAGRAKNRRTEIRLIR